MPFYSISKWRIAESFDDGALISAATMYIDELKSAGAQSGTLVRTSPTEALMVSVYADQAARDAARDKVVAMQNERMKELPVELIDEMAGPALASG